MSDDAHRRRLKNVEEIEGADSRAWRDALPAALRAFESLRDDNQ